MLNKFSWSFVSSISNTIFQLFGVIVLSRILSPTEFGIIGIMAIFIAICSMLVDSGMSGALIQQRKVSVDDYSTLFIYNLIISVFLYFIVFFIAPLISNFYEINELVLYIRIYALTIIITAVGIVQDVKLNRKLNFKAISIINIITNCVSFILAVILAWLGYGIWALILQGISSTAMRTISLYIYLGFMSNFNFSIKSFTYQFSFGSWLIASNMIRVISNNIYTNIIPKIGGLIQNGFFAQSSKIFNVVLSIVTTSTGNVIFPLLSQKENSTEAIISARKIFKNIYYISFPAFFLFSVLSYQVIIIIFGQKWLGATEYLMLLFLSGIGEVIQEMLRNILKSQRLSKEIMTLEVIKSIIRISVLFLSFSGGIKFLIIGIVISSIINTIITMVFISKNTEYKFILQLRDILQPLLLALFSYFITLVIYQYVLFQSLFAVLLFPFGYILILLFGQVIKVDEILNINNRIKTRLRFILNRI